MNRGKAKAENSRPAAGDEEASALLGAIAEMAAGAAHEINNPLTVISGRAQLMRERAADPADQKTWQTIADQAQRISDIVTELMNFASPQEPNLRDATIETIIKEAISGYLSSNLPNARGSKIDKDIGADLAVHADPQQVQAVLQELLTNAANAAHTVPYIRVSARREGSDVHITVQDSGRGMDEATLARAFTPFFSAQKAGRRRGLGLPLAWRYVACNRGRIWLESQPGEGTTAHVVLPAGE